MRFRFLTLAAMLCTAGNIQAGEADVRIESEHKLTIPNEKKQEVWAYLEERYENSESLFLREFDPTFRTETSRELFVDVYFDTPELDLLERESGVRRRSRSFPDNPTHKKHGRSLIQIKLKREGELETNRSEIKFKVKKGLKVGEGNDRGPVYLIQKDEDRREFTNRMKELGLDATTLREVLVLEQTRNRVYISNDGGPFATITLDEVTAEKSGKQARFTEVELELNEIRYTDADSEKRNSMQSVNEILRNDLQKKFEFIEVDQTPKYNKAAELLLGVP